MPSPSASRQLHLKHSRNQHINLSGMNTDKECRGLFPHVLVSDVKWGQFLHWAKRLHRWLWRGWFCDIFVALNFWMVVFTVIPGPPLWLCKYNKPKRILSSCVTTQVTTFLEYFWKSAKITMIHILLLFSALLNNTFKSVRIHLETHGLVGIRFQLQAKSQISTLGV